MLPKDPISIFLINRSAKKEKSKQRNGKNINDFFNKIELELFR